MNTATALSTPHESFADLFEQSLQTQDKTEGSVVTGIVVAIQNDVVIVDIGMKAEGKVPLREFTQGGVQVELRPGDEVEVYVERIENKHGEAVLSREKALREESWMRLERAYQKNERVEGIIFGRVKGGFTVDLEGAVAFLPGSQVDIRPVKDIGPLMGMPQPFQILKMDRRRGNIVVSRRAILEESRSEQRDALLSRIHEGQTLEGVVKNITDYGAFIDMGGIDGLLHVTDISWKRVNHPSESLSIGQTVKVMVTKFDPETKRISLGMKQLEENPWQGIEKKYGVGSRHAGNVTNLADYGAFVELEPGIEGLVHVSEMSWTKKNIHPSKILSVSQQVEVVVLDIDSTKHRISLGIKQAEANPWEAYGASHTEGETVEGEIRNITEFGLFVALDEELEGLVHTSDLSWSESGETAVKQYAKGQVVKAKILGIDVAKERISLGIKQLSEDPHGNRTEGLKKGDVATCTVTKVQDDGIEVELPGGAIAFIKRSELSRDRQEQRPDRFAVGDRVDAKISAVEKSSHKVTVSIKALEVEEQKKAIAEFGSTDSGASLGDILGAALSQAQAEAAEPAKKAAKTTKKKA